MDMEPSFFPALKELHVSALWGKTHIYYFSIQRKAESFQCLSVPPGLGYTEASFLAVWAPSSISQQSWINLLEWLMATLHLLRPTICSQTGLSHPSADENAEPELTTRLCSDPTQTMVEKRSLDSWKYVCISSVTLLVSLQWLAISWYSEVCWQIERKIKIVHVVPCICKVHCRPEE